VAVIVSLSAGGTPVTLEGFAQEFVYQTITGMLSALEGGRDFKTLELVIEGEAVSIRLNGAILPIKPFVQDIVKNTVVGMVSSLKGVNDTSRVLISIKR
jgi:hypothetical protein